VDSVENKNDSQLPSVQVGEVTSLELPEIIPYDYPHVECKSFEERQRGFELVDNVVFNVSPERMFQLIYSDSGADKNLRKYFVETGDSDIALDEWKLEEDNSLSREVCQFSYN
jgi:hypothetical protein